MAIGVNNSAHRLLIPNLYQLRRRYIGADSARYFQAVMHLGNEQAQCCFASLIGREPLLRPDK